MDTMTVHIPLPPGSTLVGKVETTVLETHLSVSRGTTPEPSPLDIGSDIAPIRIPKQAGQTNVDFNGRLSPPLKLHEDLKDGCGGQLWPAGIVLGRHLLQGLDGLVGKTIVELGAGGGLTGLGLASAISQQQHHKSPPLLLTDLPQLLPLQEQNIRLNQLSSDAVLSAAFPWGGSIPDTIPLRYRKPDIVLAADCVYFEPAFPLLLETMHELLDDASRDAVCFFCMKKRRRADMRFVAALKKQFNVKLVNFERLEDEERNVFLFQVRQKVGK